MADYVERLDALKELALLDTGEEEFTDNISRIRATIAISNIPAANVVPYSIEPDGTLIVTVPKGTKKIGRILIEEDGTQYGGLFYPDTGGCFLSSMERSEQNE